MNRLDAAFAALADPRRRQIVELLRDGPQPAGDLARATGLAPSSMSRALRTLKSAGLVRDEHPEHDARVRIYELRTGALGEVKAWLEETETLWTQQLAALGAHLRGPG